MGFTGGLWRNKGDRNRLLIRYLSFAVSNGWYHLIIVSYIDDVLGKTFGLNLVPTEEKPIFKGNMATDYGF